MLLPLDLYTTDTTLANKSRVNPTALVCASVVETGPPLRYCQVSVSIRAQVTLGFPP